MLIGQPELVKKIQDASDGEFTIKDSKLAMESVIAALTDVMLNGDVVSIIGFGKIGSKIKAGHTVYDFKTKERQVLPDHLIPFYTPSRVLKQEVAKQRV